MDNRVFRKGAVTKSIVARILKFYRMILIVFFILFFCVAGIYHLFFKSVINSQYEDLTNHLVDNVFWERSITKIEKVRDKAIISKRVRAIFVMKGEVKSVREAFKLHYLDCGWKLEYEDSNHLKVANEEYVIDFYITNEGENIKGVAVISYNTLLNKYNL